MLFVSGYLFSADILATMDKYSNDVAVCVIEKAKRMCREQADDEVWIWWYNLVFFLDKCWFFIHLRKQI